MRRHASFKPFIPVIVCFLIVGIAVFVYGWRRWSQEKEPAPEQDETEQEKEETPEE